MVAAAALPFLSEAIPGGTSVLGWELLLSLPLPHPAVVNEPMDIRIVANGCSKTQPLSKTNQIHGVREFGVLGRNKSALAQSALRGERLRNVGIGSRLHFTVLCLNFVVVGPTFLKG